MTETSEKLHFEIFVAMNEDGDIALGQSANEAKDLLLENFESLVIRIVALSAAMSPPQVETGPHVDIPDSAGETVEVEAADETRPLTPEENEMIERAWERHQAAGAPRNELEAQVQERHQEQPSRPLSFDDQLSMSEEEKIALAAVGRMGRDFPRK